MGNKLYVGNLSYNTTQETLESLFSQAGNVSEVAIVMDRMTNRPRGFAFVTMSSNDEAQKAITMYDGKEIDGRAIVVNEAKPMAPRGDGGGFGGGGGERRSGGGGFGGGGGGRSSGGGGFGGGDRGPRPGGSSPVGGVSRGWVRRSGEGSEGPGGPPPAPRRDFGGGMDENDE